MGTKWSTIDWGKKWFTMDWEQNGEQWTRNKMVYTGVIYQPPEALTGAKQFTPTSFKVGIKKDWSAKTITNWRPLHTLPPAYSKHIKHSRRSLHLILAIPQYITLKGFNDLLRH